MARLPATYEFGDIRVDAASELVLRAGTPVLLEPKAFELLVYFIQHRGQLLDKQELLDAVWGETFVTENALTRVVAQLRKALGDDAHEPKYLETVPRRGYRFVADVRTVVEAALPARRKKVLALAIAALAVFGVVVTVLMFNAPDGDEVSWSDQPVQLTSSAALDTFPSLSPDGNALAFSSNRGGSFEIYVQQLTPTGELIQLTADGSQNFQPAWSPKGDLIAYHSKTRGGIWTVPAFGGSPRKLTEFGSRPAWSPDGRTVAFQSSPLTDLGADAATVPPSTIWICALEGGAPRQLTQVDDVEGGHASPTWSPAGDPIAFLSGSRLWTVSLEGEIQLMVKTRDNNLLREVVYSPSGKKLIFADHEGLWALDSTREGAEPRLLKKSASSAIRHPSFSADGKKLAYAEVLTSSNLASIPLSPDTHEPSGPPRLLTHHTNHRNYFPRFSPDGRTVAFERFIAGSGSDVWLIDADGANERRLTTQPSFERVPRWTADGKRVIFSTARENHPFGYWTIDVETGAEHFWRPRPRHWLTSDFSPDGARVAYATGGNGEAVNIWVESADESGEARQLTFDDEMMTFPRWSPNGELLAIQIHRGANEHVGVVPAAGGEPLRLTTAPGHNWGSAWSPDSDKIAFASWRGDAWNLRWVSRTDQGECQLTDYTSLNTFVRYPAWSPLRDQIVYEFAETTGDIWMLERRYAYQR